MITGNLKYIETKIIETKTIGIEVTTENFCSFGCPHCDRIDKKESIGYCSFT